MEELIPIRDNNGQKAVNARDLHCFLQIGKDFSTWIKVQFERCDLTENVDFQVIPQKGENQKGGRPSIEYALSINAAKEISMMSQSERGKQARRYFIACEEKLHALSIPSYQIVDPVKRAEKWIEEEKVRQQLALENKEMKLKADFFDDVAGSRDAISIGDLAKVLGIRGMGRNNLFEFLRNERVLMDNNLPYQRYVDCSYFRVIEQKYMRNGEPCIGFKTLVYQKGVAFVRSLLKKSLNAINQK